MSIYDISVEYCSDGVYHIVNYYVLADSEEIALQKLSNHLDNIGIKQDDIVIVTSYGDAGDIVIR